MFGNPDEILDKWREIEGGKEHKIEWNFEEYTKHINWIKGKVTEFLINSVLNPPDINAIESEKRQFSNIQHILLIGGPRSKLSFIIIKIKSCRDIQK